MNIRLRTEKEDFVIAICDEVPGFSAEDKVSVFATFYRGISLSKDGTGLGLAMMKAVAVAHRGRVEIVDNEPQGTCLKVGLPSLLCSG